MIFPAMCGEWSAWLLFYTKCDVSAHKAFWLATIFKAVLGTPMGPASVAIRSPFVCFHDGYTYDEFLSREVQERFLLVL